MKKLMVFLAGFGLVLVLVAGSFETSVAEGKSSVFQKNTFSSDSVSAQSLQEKAENNSIYLKPGPAKPEKVAGEFLLGGVGAVLAGGAGMAIGYNITYDPGQDDWMNFSGIAGAIAGYLVGSNLGSATGVYLIGNSGGEKGSYLATFGGSLAGTLVGGLIAVPLIRNSDEDEGLLPLVVFTSAQATGATIGFNLSRKGKKIDVYSEAVLNLNDGKLNLAYPHLTASTDSYSSSHYRVNLFQVKF